MTKPKMLHRGYTGDVLEDKAPSQDSLRRRFGIEGENEDDVGPQDDGEEEEEEEEEDSFEIKELEMPSSSGTQSKSGGRGMHTLYHGRRQNSFFRTMEKAYRATVFDDDDSDLDMNESASMASNMAFGEDGSVVSNLTSSLEGLSGSMGEKELGNPANDLSVAGSDGGFLSITEVRGEEPGCFIK